MEVFKIFGTLGLKDTEYRNGLRRSENEGRKASQSISNGFNPVNKTFGMVGASALAMGIGLAGVAGASLGLATGLVGAVKEGMSFEKQMSKVQSISGSSGYEMGELTAKARELGKSTRYSSTEVAEGFEFMSLAGWNASQQISAIGPLLSMATAGNMDLGRATDIVTDTMTGFGMQANEAGKASDLFAVTQSKTNTSIDQLGEAMKYVAPVANSFGMNLSDTNVILGEFANAGTKGSMAGTALRAGLSRLAGPPKEASKALDALGVSTTNTDGSMRNIRDIVGDLSKGFSNLSQEQQIVSAKAIFGQEAFSAWLPVIKGGTAEFDRLKRYMDMSSGSADMMAKVMSNNLDGATKNMMSSASNLGLVLYDKMTPALMSATNGTTGLIEGITNYLDPTGQAVEATQLLAGTKNQLAMEELILQNEVKQGIINGEEAKQKMKEMKQVMDENLTAKGMLATKEQELAGQLESGQINREQYNQQMREAEVIMQKRAEAVQMAQEKEAQWSAVIEGIMGPLQTLGTAFVDLWNAKSGEGVPNSAKEIFTQMGLSPEAQEMAMAVIEGVKQGIDLIMALVTGDWGEASKIAEKIGLTPQTQQTIADVVTGVISIVTNLASGVMSLIGPIGSFISMCWDGILQVTNAVWGAISPYVTTIVNQVNSVVTTVIGRVKSFWDNNNQAIKQITEVIWGVISVVFQTALNVILGIITTVFPVIRGIIETVMNAIQLVISLVLNLITGNWEGVWNSIVTFFQQTWDTIVNVADGVLNGLLSFFQGTINTIGTVFKVVTKAIGGPFEDAWKTVDKVVGWIGKAVDKVKGFISGIADSAKAVGGAVAGALGFSAPASGGGRSMAVSASVGGFANGGVFKPGMERMVKIGDAKGYDEAIMPLNDDVFQKIGNGVAESLGGTGGKDQDIHLTAKVEMDGKVVGELVADTVERVNTRKKETRKLF
ncbi:phage tail tape measure protein [Bacillus sp. TK-2]|nr:phage tail tape measure protein [Bacillus cereus]QQP77654.1 phage tail tape measure protein [Bacillus sp. TK-2]